MKAAQPTFLELAALLCAAVVIAGCASVAGLSHQKNMRGLYVKTHRERPAEILGAVLEGTMTPGMNAREAALCWGAPTRTEPFKSGGNSGEVWVYEETRSRGASSLYDITVTKSRLTMTNGPAGPHVAHWVMY